MVLVTTNAQTTNLKDDSKKEGEIKNKRGAGITNTRRRRKVTLFLLVFLVYTIAWL